MPDDAPSEGRERHWFHCISTTYGTWLPGDERGWRTRHHRGHVDGDYKSPPVDSPFHRSLRTQSNSALRRRPVRLSKPAQQMAAEELVKKLTAHQVNVLAIAIDDHHCHVLALFPDDRPRHWMGIARKHAARQLSDAKLVKPGGVWAKRDKCVPVIDRSHQIQALRYIFRHRERGACVCVSPTVGTHRWDER